MTDHASMPMPPLSPGQILDRATVVFGIPAPSGVQLWEGAALLAAARPAGLPSASDEPAVRSWAETNGVGAYRPLATPFPLAPVAPALIYGPPDADWPGLIALLATRYPASHPAQFAWIGEDGSLLGLASITIAALNPAEPRPPAAWCMLLLSPLHLDARGLDGLRWVTARLLGPGGCPWDVRQTHQSLRVCLLEEAYEVLEALDAGDMAALTEELGDLLLTVLVHSEMARQAGHFALEDVLEQISAKLIGRHPHVFGALSVDGEEQVLRNWEQIKAAELAARGRTRASALDGVPPGMPALAAAQKLGKKAARAGFNWRELSQVWAKLHEELDELATADSAANAAEELGDVLFVLTRLADWLGLDAETALREASARFRRRFGRLEALAAAQGLVLTELEPPRLLELWAQARQG
ncbi:MAG: nucleoside triphosphate pyrophosphohydrolase [Chloroflexi bacterium OHK40]